VKRYFRENVFTVSLLEIIGGKREWSAMRNLAGSGEFSIGQSRKILELRSTPSRW
jgi:hypothetical protein